MADLLECVIQIKALADTPRRLALRLREAGARGPTDAIPVLRGLVAYEAWLQDSLEAGLSVADARTRAEPAPIVSSDAGDLGRDPGEGLMAQFASLRGATVRRLDSLDAAQLSARVLVDGRGPATIADLVALALAHDTDGIAIIVRTRC